MNTRQLGFLAGVLLITGLAGAAFAESGDQAEVNVAVAEALAAVTPPPTPAPTPVPTPQIVEVTPQVCLDALDALNSQDLPLVSFTRDVLGAYLDYPDEDLADFGRRVESLLTNLQAPDDSVTERTFALWDDCEAAAR